jgi:methionine-rich copper-binding protein CopC
MSVFSEARPTRRTLRTLVATAAALFLAASNAAFASHGGVSRVGGEEGQDGHVAPKALNGVVAPLAVGNLKYYGGKVISNAKVYQVLYGSGTYIPEVSGAQMGNFYQQVTNSAYMDWQSEYNTVGVVPVDGGPSSNQTIGRGSFAGKIQITPAASRNGSTITDAQIQTELKAQITAGVLPMPDANTVYMIDFPAGKTISQGGSNSCQAGGFCAYHSTVAAASPIPEFYYGVLPDMSASSGCSSGCGTSTVFNNQTSVASHELLEAITDAEVGIGTTVSRPLAWYDTANGENADICNAQQGTIVGTDGVTYTVQKSWSNRYAACIVVPPVTGNDFSISVTPSTRTVTAGTGTTYTLNTAVTSGSAQTLSLSVTGLPTGATASFNPTSVVAGNSDTMTVSTSASTPAGSYTLTVRGTAGSGSHTATTTLVVTTVGGTFPESAHPYVNNYDNTWTYTLTGAPASINVTFDAQTKVETNYDYIYVMDKNGVNIAGSPFTSTTLAGVTKNVPGDTVKIRLKTDVSVVYYGFKVTAVTAGGGGGDTTLPTVSISSPASGATITGSTTVSATASDNVGVTKVEFYLDGALQATDTTSPYGWVWSPTSAQNGGHSLTAKAYDAAGNTKTSTAVSVTVSISSSCTPQQLIANGGFETGSASPWTASAGVIDSSASEPSHSGTYKAWMDGYGSAHTDTLSQSVSIPACATTATLTFWLHIDTAETGSTAYDVLTVKAGSTTLATYSNANAAAGYVQKSLNVIAFKGQTVSISFTAVEDASLQTSFVIDDAALNTQ